MIRATRPSPVDWVGAGVHERRHSAAFLDQRAAATPDGPAVVDGGRRLSWAELHAGAAAFAGWLGSVGVVRGDVVTVQLPNWWEAAVIYQGLTRQGGVANPVVPIYRERELAFIVDQAQPRVVVIPHRFRDFDYVAMLETLVAGRPSPPTVVVVRPEGPLPAGFVAFDSLPPVRPGPPVGRAEDICLLLYTSGTTADPKGVLHSHDTVVYEVRSIVERYGLGPGDSVFAPSPVTHITGLLFGLLLSAVIGAPVVLVDRWDPAAAADLLDAEACRFTMAATPFLHGLVEEYGRRGHPAPLRYFMCGGADVPPALVRRATEVLGCHVTRTYGSSEFPTFCSGRPGDGPDITADTDGVPIGQAEGRIDGPPGGPGELVVRGPDLFLGYLDPALNAEAFTEDGYFRTGDLATVDDRGAVTIRGRQKDIIIRGGENVSAKEVEDLLFAHPLVAQVAVVAMPDPVLGERGCAFVVPADGSAPTLAALTAYLEAQGLARQKFPERLELVDQLPTTASGKVQKFVLRQRVAALLEAELAGSGGPGV